jgi:1-acyl-sn-glycerol-3-phosphate acyltransferase
MLRDVLRSVISGLYKLLTRVEVSGLENVPEKGSFILAVNHLSRLDPPLVYVLLKRKDVTGLAADKYKKNLIFRWIVEAVDAIWINREAADFHAMREALKYLEAGGILGIAPEGTRSTTGGLITAKTGVAYLAGKANVPILPCAVYGTELALKKLLHLQRLTIRVLFGKLFVLPIIDRRDRDGSLRQNTDEIMCRIAAMLPPAYRGVYAGHPRLKELLADTQAV